MHEADQLRAQAERIVASGVLGRSRLLERLFEFLVDCSVSGKAPKELEVAIDVFGKGAGFDVSQDAMVRVYVHKLRRKLEEFYAGPGRAEAFRMVMPKGAYRFVLTGMGEPASAAPAPSAPRWGRLPRWLAVTLAASLCVNVAALLFVAYSHWRSPTSDLSDVRTSPVWSRILNDDRTIFLAVGDYYIFGETDESMEVKRLIREFSINSPDDLDQYAKLHPKNAEHYLDLKLDYLPTAAAFAMRDIVPILEPVNKRVRVVLASELNPGVLTSAHVIYLGYLSGMGMLHDITFAGSRFTIGDSYDELVDRSSGTRYISQAAMPMPGEGKYHDFGYFATFSGPSGNQIVIIAGTRDVAVMHTAQAVTRPETLEQLVSSAAGASSFEALYDVYGLDRLNLDGKLLLTSRMNTTRIWTGEPQRLIGAAAVAPILTSR